MTAGYIIIQIVEILFSFLELAIIVDSLLSFIPMNKSNALVDFLHCITEPIERPFKKLQERFIPGFMMDFSPMLALVAIWILGGVIRMIIEMVLL